MNKIVIWECSKCGMIMSRKEEPNTCSCGYKKWFRNSQVEGIIGLHRTDMLEEFKELSTTFDNLDDRDKVRYKVKELEKSE